MTMQKSDAELIARLRARKGGWKSNVSYADGAGPLINPDGPEAADRLEALCTVRDDKALIERLRGLLEKAETPNPPDWYRPWRVEPDHPSPSDYLSFTGSVSYVPGSAVKNDAMREALEACLAREAEWAKLRDRPECNCIILSRDAEREYETGTCPHQRARAALQTKEPE